ncbi:hypothetical protein CAI21_14075 [Alkalilimnicola ehrlichii]|uniref:Uncharacterized protein n=1 Tax=Alkalilimnicola ehrlichii TaxID=351052 RepID=A0A3E0WX10_9GAMM|nr:hypothetical protein [Alkalilimnicola ehrlichii]RFA27747.1 hypothetical protein CAI21_14075 [Alkalilimnicola ehrlichii]RFA36919.1 hypothetical protein CAL65_10455 [Alkalilimnicola ehrlichii]
MEENKNISLDKLIDSPYRLAVLDTAEPERLLSLFKRQALTSGRAIYDWSPENGLYRLGIEHIFIPRTRAPADALAYVISSRHYGIYLLREFDIALGKPSIHRQLTQLLEKEDKIRRLVVFLGKDIEIPAVFDSYVARLRHQIRPSQRASNT